MFAFKKSIISTLLNIELNTDKNDNIYNTITVGGWIKSIRVQGKNSLAFIELNDGSCLKNLQVIFDKDNISDEDIFLNGTVGVSLLITGKLVKSPCTGQNVELIANEYKIYGYIKDADTYPISKKKHTMEHLRNYPHLRVRTNIISTAMRIRNTCTMATHSFFQNLQFINIHTPLITGSDCEGAGETFAITNLLRDTIEHIPIIDNKDKYNIKKIDYGKDFFKCPAYLTVSGQLNAESYACGLSNVYTFGPTFRAENSHSTRHLAEFWMIEPECVFVELSDIMDLAEDYLKYCVNEVIKNHGDELTFLDKFVSNGLIEKLNNIIVNSFKRITYYEAIELLLNEIKTKNIIFEYPIAHDIDIATEHEKYLTEYYKSPVIVYNYPKNIKTFYMKANGINEAGIETVSAMDLLLPKIGEIIGGSIREDDYEKLVDRITENNLNKDNLDWYLDLRKYGTVPHGGFGLGFERLIMYVTGIENIRDVIPFPRYPGHIEC